MPILTCPNCQGQLRLGVEAAGRKVRCPRCQQVFTAGVAAPESSAESSGAPDPFGFLEEAGSPKRKRSGRRPPEERKSRPSEKSPRKRRRDEDDEPEDEDEDDDLDDQERMARSKAERRAVSERLDHTGTYLGYAGIGLLLYSLSISINLLTIGVAYVTGWVDFALLGAQGAGMLSMLGGLLLLLSGVMLAVGGERRHGAQLFAMAMAGTHVLYLGTFVLAFLIVAAAGDSGEGAISPMMIFPALLLPAKVVLLMLFISRLGVAIGDADLKRNGLRLAIYIPCFLATNAILLVVTWIVLIDTFGIRPGKSAEAGMPIGAQVFIGGFLLSTIITWASLLAYAGKLCRQAGQAAEDAA